ncbi:hypothetical protein D9V84_02570 [Bacteroidetes/Chlorobi group bacterium Naka2016]|jgi:CHASE3 domain sensor protein|nr:MAG: hypothetical protein D9V84_02570 [Bacteroidetes/Chlorobi group bacterium Naka2016]
MKISTKLTIGVTGISVVLLFVAVLLFWTSNRVANLIIDIQELPKLQAKLGTLTIQHYQWVEALGVGTMLMKKPFTKALDPTKCDLGKWYYSFTPPEELKDEYVKVEEPHKRIHASGTKILDAVNKGDIETAIQIYQTETLPNLDSTRTALTNLRLGAMKIINKNLHNIENSMNNLKNIVIIAFAILLLLTSIISYFFLIKPLKQSFKKVISLAEAVSRGDFSAIKEE